MRAGAHPSFQLYLCCLPQLLPAQAAVSVSATGQRPGCALTQKAIPPSMRVVTASLK